MSLQTQAVTYSSHSNSPASVLQSSSRAADLCLSGTVCSPLNSNTLPKPLYTDTSSCSSTQHRQNLQERTALSLLGGELEIWAFAQCKLPLGKLSTVCPNGLTMNPCAGRALQALLP